MPKTKYGERFSRPSAGEEVMGLVFGQAAVKRMRNKDIAALMGISPVAFSRMKNDVTNLKLSTLLNLCKRMDIPIEKVREVIHY